MTALLTTSLHAWRDQYRLYRPLALMCVASAVLCVGLAILKPTPALFALLLIVFFSVPWVYAVVHRGIQLEMSEAHDRAASGELPG